MSSTENWITELRFSGNIGSRWRSIRGFTGLWLVFGRRTPRCNLSGLSKTRALTRAYSGVDSDMLVRQSRSLGQILRFLVQQPATQVSVEARLELLELKKITQAFQVVISFFALEPATKLYR